METTVSCISRWLGHCYQSHNDFCGTPTVVTLPTRILRIEGRCRVRLHIAGVDQPAMAQYACLSHCWGGVKPIETTRSTLSAFQWHIPWHTLPRTFQDAIGLVHRLGFEYLWIDSLCTIQDDEEDWRQESSNMASIYASASLTIAATRSKDAHGGLFGEPPPEKKVYAYNFPKGASA